MPKRKPTDVSGTKGKAAKSSAAGTSPGTNNRLAQLIASAIVKDTQVLKDILEALPDEVSQQSQHNLDGTEIDTNSICSGSSVSTGIEDTSSTTSSTAVEHTGCLDEHVQQPVDLGMFSLIHPNLNPKLRARILNREFVDLSEVFYADSNISETTTIQKFHNSTVKSVHKAAKKEITNIMIWTRAFQIYADVYTSKYPQEAPQMFRYMTIIQTIAHQNAPWLNYDSKFRQLKATTNLAWGSIHTETYFHCTIMKPSFRPSNSTPAKVPIFILQRRGYCWDYQKFNNCYKQQCERFHKCSNCELFSHGANRCTRPIRTSLQSDNQRPKSDGFHKHQTKTQPK